MLLIIALLLIIAGIMYFYLSFRKSYNIKVVKGLQQPGETDQQYEQRLRKKLKRHGIILFFLGVFCLVMDIIFKVLDLT
ncbi:hypothetical protein [Paenibacillus oleatilyticus]|uniref:hypothetical protein n=1 Tax=Paenibacillus oleatilyticus TaxID=2594886 RepID=UPI001C1FB7F1|nr:hypothetical protein [Paenibacillus oleatilyticus]MBU7319548.1 hypothetical protein [Paenibacillus oleatilyticus]